MTSRYDCANPEQREEGLAAATAAVQRGDVVVLPTDTVYGIGVDAFTPSAVSALLAAKGRGRNAPPPVLVGSVRAATALTESLGAFGQDLIDEFWPGPLTLVFRSSPSLLWDLGDTLGTVAIRMPLHALTLDLLRRTGPMAVSSANRQSLPAAKTADEALDQLGDSVAVYLDDGPCTGGVPSTILDLTGTVPRMLRAGALHIDAIRKIVPVIDLPEDQGGEPDLSPADRRAAAAIAEATAASQASAEATAASQVTAGDEAAAGSATAAAGSESGAPSQATAGDEASAEPEPQPQPPADNPAPAQGTGD